MKIYEITKESTYFMDWDVKRLCRKLMPQKLLLDGFELVKNTSKFDEDFIKITLKKL